MIRDTFSAPEFVNSQHTASPLRPEFYVFVPTDYVTTFLRMSLISIVELSVEVFEEPNVDLFSWNVFLIFQEQLRCLVQDNSDEHQQLMMEVLKEFLEGIQILILRKKKKKKHLPYKHHVDFTAFWVQFIFVNFFTILHCFVDISQILYVNCNNFFVTIKLP